MKIKVKGFKSLIKAVQNRAHLFPVKKLINGKTKTFYATRYVSGGEAMDIAKQGYKINPYQEAVFESKDGKRKNISEKEVLQMYDAAGKPGILQEFIKQNFKRPKVKTGTKDNGQLSLDNMVNQSTGKENTSKNKPESSGKEKTEKLWQEFEKWRVKASEDLSYIVNSYHKKVEDMTPSEYRRIMEHFFKEEIARGYTQNGKTIDECLEKYIQMFKDDIKDKEDRKNAWNEEYYKEIYNHLDEMHKKGSWLFKYDAKDYLRKFSRDKVGLDRYAADNAGKAALKDILVKNGEYKEKEEKKEPESGITITGPIYDVDERPTYYINDNGNVIETQDTKIVDQYRAKQKESKKEDEDINNPGNNTTAARQKAIDKIKEVETRYENGDYTEEEILNGGPTKDKYYIDKTKELLETKDDTEWENYTKRDGFDLEYVVSESFTWTNPDKLVEELGMAKIKGKKSKDNIANETRKLLYKRVHDYCGYVQNGIDYTGIPDNLREKYDILMKSKEKTWKYFDNIFKNENSSRFWRLAGEQGINTTEQFALYSMKYKKPSKEELEEEKRLSIDEIVKLTYRLGTKKIESKKEYNVQKSVDSLVESIKPLKDKHTDIKGRAIMDMMGLNIPLYSKRNGKYFKSGGVDSVGVCRYFSMSDGTRENREICLVADRNNPVAETKTAVHECMHAKISDTLTVAIDNFNEGNAKRRVALKFLEETLVETAGQAISNLVHGNETDKEIFSYVNQVASYLPMIWGSEAFKDVRKNGIHGIGKEIAEQLMANNGDFLTKVVDEFAADGSKDKAKNRLKALDAKIQERTDKVQKIQEDTGISAIGDLVEELKRGTISLEGALNSSQYRELAAVLITKFLEDEDLDALEELALSF